LAVCDADGADKEPSMRILYSHRIQSRDGQSVHVEEMIAALRAAGAEVRVVGPGFYAQAGFGGESRMVARLRRVLPGALAELAELAYNIPAYLRLRRACRDFRPDLIYERYNLFYLAGALLARRRGVPFFLEVNAPLAEERKHFGGLRLARLAHALEAWVWRAADRVFAVTGVLGEMIARKNVSPSRIVITPNGIDPAAFPPMPENLGTDRPLVLGFVGFVRDWHGLDGVIAEMARAPENSLLLRVVGDGPARAALEAQAKTLGIAERVRFTGLIDRAGVPGEISRFDIALQPRVVAYASPLKIFEYMAAGRAIIAPDQPNIREILEHERTALLFDPQQPGAMWQAILRLAADPLRRQQLGAAAQAEITRRNYTWAGNAARVLTLAATTRML